MKNLKAIFILILLAALSSNAYSQYTSLKISAGPTLILSSFKNTAQSASEGFTARTSYTGNFSVEVQTYFQSHFLFSYGGTLFLNGFSYHLQPNDSEQFSHTATANDYCIGLFSTAGYELMESKKNEWLVYTGLKGAYGFSEFQLYLPVGMQFGFRTRGNTCIGICAEYNLLLNPVYTKINPAHITTFQAYNSEIKKLGNFINLTAYINLPLTGKRVSSKD